MRAWSLFLCLMLSIGSLVSLAEDAVAQDGPQQLLVAEGIDAPILVDIDVDAVPDGTALVLQRISLPSGTALENHQSASPELLYIENGTVIIADSFGFETQASAGTGLSLIAGTEYQATNSSGEPVTFLRVGFGLGRATVDSSEDASPVAVASPAATPVVDTVSITNLVESPIDPSVVPSGVLFLSQVTLEPGSTSGPQANSGALGIYVESGTLSARSPSGLEGQVAAGKAVGYPMPGEVVVGNSSADDAVLLVAGIAPAAGNGSFLAEVAPEPTPTTEPTATHLPTPTPEPTPTIEPTATLPPTPTPEPSPTPIPTAVPTTPPDVVLPIGETWEGEFVHITVEHVGTSIVDGSPEFQITYRNVSSARLDANFPSGFIHVYDDLGKTWQIHAGGGLFSGGLTLDRIILDPGETFSFELVFAVSDNFSEVTSYVANVFVELEGFDSVPTARWGFTYDHQEVSPIPPGIIPPGQSGTSDQSASAAGTDLLEILPSEQDVPNSLGLVNTRTRTLDEATANYTNPSETASYFQSLGWQGNAICSFVLPDGSQASPNQINGIYASVHLFGGSDAARHALDFSLSEQAAGTSLQEVPSPDLGEYSRALYGPTDYGDEATLLVQQGPRLLRVSAASTGIDPTTVAMDVMQGMLDRAGITSTTTASTTTVSLDSFGLSDSLVPEGLVLQESGNLSAEFITSWFIDPDEAMTNFTQWGWQENYYQTFVSASGGPNADGLTYLEIGVHRFADASSADQALAYISDVRQRQLGLSTVTVPNIGDQSQAIGGPTETGFESTVYIRMDNLVLRITAFSDFGEPTVQAVAVAQSVAKRE